MRAALHSDIRLLNEANESILSHNGKMIRPAMALLFARACAGTVSEEGHKVAAAAELLHNATLLHDDVADRSDQRRGAPTASSVYGANAAVLLGDYWLVKAMDLMLSTGPFSMEIIRIFAKTLSDLAEGEIKYAGKNYKEAEIALESSIGSAEDEYTRMRAYIVLSKVVMDAEEETATGETAADQAMSGMTNVGNCVYFRTPVEGLSGINIGNHVFY